MFSKHKKALLSEVQYVEERIESLKELIVELGQGPGRAKAKRDELRLKKGQIVRVWAAHADSHGHSVSGELCEVLEELDHSEPFKSAIKVRLVSPSSNGLTILVYPEQCVLEKPVKE